MWAKINQLSATDAMSLVRKNHIYVLLQIWACTVRSVERQNISYTSIDEKSVMNINTSMLLIIYW